MLRRVNHNQVRSELRSKGVGKIQKKHARAHTHTHTHTHTHLFSRVVFLLQFPRGEWHVPRRFSQDHPHSRLSAHKMFAISCWYWLAIRC